MAVWLVRAGRHGEQEQVALDNNVVAIGWNELPDLSVVTDRQGMVALYTRFHQDDSRARIAQQVSQLWSFRELIQQGDLAVTPLRTRSAIAVGEVGGRYEYTTALGEIVHHVHRVKWLRIDLPRTAFNQDLLSAFNLPKTVYRINLSGAQERILTIQGGAPDPGGSPGPGGPGDEDAEVADSGWTPDIEQVARDQILEYIQQNFSRHRLADLVNAVLQAEGYQTWVSPPGPDGGVDILAGTGPMGFDVPRLCVQVRSSPTPSDVNALRGLQGVLQTFRAKQGLLVCWGGFTNPVLREARHSFFKIRLWDSGDLLGMIFKNHDKFPDGLKAELPLKRIWTLVPEE